MKDFEKEFKRKMEKEGLGEMTKPFVYVARYKSPKHKGEEPYKLDEFRTKAARDKWYETIGKYIEDDQGGKIEFSEEPVKDIGSSEE